MLMSGNFYISITSYYLMYTNLFAHTYKLTQFSIGNCY